MELKVECCKGIFEAYETILNRVCGDAMTYYIDTNKNMISVNKSGYDTSMKVQEEITAECEELMCLITSIRESIECYRNGQKTLTDSELDGIGNRISEVYEINEKILKLFLLSREKVNYIRFLGSSS